MLFIVKRKVLKGIMNYFVIDSDDVFERLEHNIHTLELIPLRKDVISDMLNKGVLFGNIEYRHSKGTFDAVYTDLEDYSINARTIKYQPAVVVTDRKTECIQYIGCCSTDGKLYKMDIEFFNKLVKRGLVVDFSKTDSEKHIRLQILNYYPRVKRELGIGISVISKDEDKVKVSLTYVNRDNNIVTDIQEVIASDMSDLKKNIKIPEYSTDFDTILEKL